MITLTEIAAKQITKIKEELGNSDAFYLRFGVKGGGCSGLSYNLDLDDKPIQETDQIFESNGVKIVTNELCLTYVDGTEIDYIEKLYGGGFKFNNPHAKRNCGCSQSFTPEDDVEN